MKTTRGVRLLAAVGSALSVSAACALVFMTGAAIPNFIEEAQAQTRAAPTKPARAPKENDVARRVREIVAEHVGIEVSGIEPGFDFFAALSELERQELFIDLEKEFDFEFPVEDPSVERVYSGCAFPHEFKVYQFVFELICYIEKDAPNSWKQR